MKPIDFPSNDHSMIFQYMRMREGPNYFMCKYKQSSVLRQDPKDAWRVMGSAKFTANSQELKQWCLDIHDKYGHVEEESKKDTSFASEVQQEHEEPNDNTKMVT